MNSDWAIGPGLPSPIYPELSRDLVNAAVLPDDRIRFVLGVCSAYAYGNPSAVATVMDRLGLTRNRVRMISEYVDALFLTSTAYLIQSHDGQVVILCYRGTPPTSAVTWLTDFEVEPVTIDLPGPPGPAVRRVHGGFYRNVRSTRFKIVELLQDAIDGKSVLVPGENPRDEPPVAGLKALYITGHSLGGASAALFAALLKFEPITQAAVAPDAHTKIIGRLRAVYTYGSPMIGNPAFAAACNQDPLLRTNVIRYVYANDVVPQVPPKASGPFRHFGEEYRYTPPGAKGHWHPSRRSRTQLRNLVQLLTAPLAIGATSLKITRPIPFHASLSDHFPQYYLDALTPPGLRSEFGD
ncbi:MAG: lipase family protein [Solirubrobacteraceae bacterium]